MAEPSSAGHDKDIEQSALPPVSRTYVSQRLPLHYVDWDNAGALTLLPQLGLHSTRVQARFPYYRPDLPRRQSMVDSQWSIEGNYPIAGFIFDVAELIHQQALAPVILIGFPWRKYCA